MPNESNGPSYRWTWQEFVSVSIVCIVGGFGGWRDTPEDLCVGFAPAAQPVNVWGRLWRKRHGEYVAGFLPYFHGDGWWEPGLRRRIATEILANLLAEAEAFLAVRERGYDNRSSLDRSRAVQRVEVFPGGPLDEVASLELLLVFRQLFQFFHCPKVLFATHHRLAHRRTVRHLGQHVPMAQLGSKASPNGKPSAI